MPLFETVTTLACPVERVWDFLCNPANLVAVSPPELHLRLVEGPERLHLGARLTIAGRRWGIPQRIVSEVTAFEPNVLFRDEQREGPFRKFTHTHRLEPVPEGTRMLDQIEFEPPGGVLGLILSAGHIERELRTVFAVRAQKFKELLEGRAPSATGEA
jgi:ligand-binding SRPBCC domain-containing protein